MGTQISTVFSPVRLAPHEVAGRLLEFFTRELGGYLEPYFAEVRYDAANCRFEFFGETQISGEDELLARLQREGQGMFSCELDLGFAPTSADVALFTGPEDTDRTTTVVTFEKELTSYLFTSEVTATPFALVLERIARVIGAECFVAGAEYVRWLPLPPRLLADPKVLGASPQVVGWRHGVVDEKTVLAALRARPEWLERTLHDFDLVSMTGRYPMRLPPQSDPGGA